MKVKTILVSQPEQSENSPYHQIIDKYKVKIDFRPFTEVQGVTGKDLRSQKIDLTQHTAIILTSRNAVDHFFRVAEEMRFKVPDTMRYFCLSEAVAFYLQKYITYRKRKIYVGKKDFTDLIPSIKKHKEENYLFPTSEVLSPAIEKSLNDLKIKWSRAIFYKTVHSDISDLKDTTYDVIALFSPAGVESLYKNFPDFKQEKTRIAVFGASTLKVAEEAGLKIDIQAPLPETPSMTMALEKYLEKTNKKS
ncbi:MAG: uroporphyrinogen-III synthase [Capnocytophaga sp.]|nr:uroporphyrinogen-III synthase [Capnocytophaga sp.]